MVCQSITLTPAPVSRIKVSGSSEFDTLTLTQIRPSRNWNGISAGASGIDLPQAGKSAPRSRIEIHSRITTLTPLQATCHRPNETTHFLSANRLGNSLRANRRLRLLLSAQRAQKALTRLAAQGASRRAPQARGCVRTKCDYSASHSNDYDTPTSSRPLFHGRPVQANRTRGISRPGGPRRRSGGLPPRRIPPGPPRTGRRQAGTGKASPPRLERPDRRAD